MATILPHDQEREKRSSAQVAPLNILKSPHRSQSRASSHHRQSSSRDARSLRSQSQLSPPLTPRSSTEALPQTPAQPVFHNYLRAFYHFHPSTTVSSSTDESSITVPISQGDVILVHSVHPNGWADGTLLASGARGWLPTNYCEAYNHPCIRSLLNALTNLWDLVRDGENGDLMAFAKQDYVRGMIAGVRLFLEKTHCLTRESSLVVAHVSLRRMRKGLLGDLSSLVKTAKRIQESVQATQDPVFALLDELVLRAFKLVTRGVRFLDIWLQESAALPFDTGEVSSNRPLTPLSDTSNTVVHLPAVQTRTDPQIAVANGEQSSVSQAKANVTLGNVDDAAQPSRSLNRFSVAFSIPSDSDTVPSPPSPLQPQTSMNRLSVTHRLSYTSKSQGARKQFLASERLNATHDSFLGFIGSFIGLHLQSRSSEDLTVTTQQSVVACRQLLAIVDQVWERDSRRSSPLEQARDIMHTRLTDLVQATKNMFRHLEETASDDLIAPDSGKRLVAAATSCVRSAGECVTKARAVIERIGDFEFEHEATLSQSTLVQVADSPSIQEQHLAAEKLCPHSAEENKPLPAPPAEGIKQLPPLITTDMKPLPDVPVSPKTTQDQDPEPTTQTTMPGTPMEESARSSVASLPSLNHLPMPNLSHASPSDYTNSPASSTQRFFGKSPRTDSVNASVADSSSSYHYSVRDTGSIISQASTRATTPDHSPLKQQSSQTLTSSFSSSFELRSVTSEDVSATEQQLLETTYAHELLCNKEGQIVGGSLPALVEQLTTHESTPDVIFVNAFYLTFRLFTTPVELTQCLLDRFDHVGDSSSVGIPVRLRVYNVFKGWLESHWVGETDSAALGLIFSFAMGKLRSALPVPGKHLAELTSKVTDIRGGNLVPRLASSRNPSNAGFTAADNVPSPVLTRSQVNALKSWKEGKTQCTILEFDPLELARQLTLIESRLYCSIKPEELLALEWTKKTDSKATNVLAMSTLSNDLFNLVADSVLQLEDAKKRAMVIKQWVKVSVRCLELNNYDSLMAITCALHTSTVARLKKTWELVSAKTKTRLEEVKSITDVARNYAVLRSRLQNHVAPCIPFVGIYLTDLTFIDAGNGATRQLPGEAGRRLSVVNFDKHMKTAKIIGQVQAFQVPYRLAAVPELQEWLDDQMQKMRVSDQANMQMQYRRSLWLEPKETNTSRTPSVSAEGGVSGPLTADSRVSSKDRFDFLNFHFSTNPTKDR